MKNLKLKKLVAMALTLASVVAVSPVAASAEWKQDSIGWWNTEGDSYSIGWRLIDGSWYYFDSTGYMKTGWVIDYSAGYGQWYYLKQSGAMQTGWINDKGTWYYLNKSGAMQTGWINDNGTWYFADESGAMLTGVIQVDGKVYYLQPSGAMATGTVEINGVTYTFAASGEAIGENIPTPEKTFGTVPESNVTDNINDDKDNSDNGSSSSSSGGSSSHSGGGSSSSTPKAVSDYRSSANINVTEQEEDTLKVEFVNDTIELKNNADYVTRDIYVVSDDAQVTKGEENGKTYYLVKYNKDSKLEIKGVTRIVRNGVVYYATSNTFNK